MSKIDYDLTLIKGIALDVDGVLSPSTVQLDSSGRPLKMCNVKDGYALQLAVKKGLKIWVITGGSSQAIVNRMHLLGIFDIWENAGDKLPALVEWMNKNGLEKEDVAYMGDDIPDLRCLRRVGLPCCPYDAAWEVKQESIYVSDHSGGYGAVRDIIEQVLKSQKLWSPDLTHNLIW